MRIAKATFGLVLAAGMCLAVLIAHPAAAQDSSAMKQVGMVRTGAGTFTIDAEGADIRTVLKAIAEFSGKNIVIGKDVKATVKVSLRNVGWQEALRTVLRSNGLDYVEEGGILRVDEATRLNAEAVDRETARAKTAELLPLETGIVKLNYANASELNTTLQATLSRRGQIQVDRRTNSLIITDLPQNLEAATRMAQTLDSTTPQIEITAKLVDVDAEALRGMGIDWRVGGTSKYFVYPFGDPQAGKPVQLAPLTPGNDKSNSLYPDIATTIADPAGTLTYGLSKSWGQLEAQLQLLESTRKANIISNPRVTTVDNREAKILVGQKIPLIVQDVAGNPVSQLQTIGIQLKVTPHLTQDKKIIMDLHPEVSDLSTQSTVQGGVIINTSEADTRVMVDDGQTAVIGGLIRTNDSHVRRGIPFLKDVPLVGMLFRSDNVVKQNRELIIFVTPRLLASMANN
ncbi:MAG: type IV pilus secretin PilQ [Candidatus Eisenbacteria bacterium]|uniref:Type IV pilus secretin PilQ n=1 Tax=Eiseniibacteriota bacterium TaxID=2212470 RepID=A0A9D6LBI3_UNCEI|nr:type IV pilus secretin PilQ [Candidatus Eisenbacteria bacterium]MBI3539639.1 type IV pilus secretin PilQ [Candidatus Eisenbacteria bacterium]